MKIKHFFMFNKEITAKCYIYLSPQLIFLIRLNEKQVPVLVLAFRHMLSVLNLKNNRRCNNADLFFQKVTVSAAPKTSNGWRFLT